MTLSITISPRRLGRFLLASGLLLFIPLLSMALTAEVRWSGSDFVLAGLLLTMTSLALEGALALTAGRPRLRWAMVAAVLLGLVAVWAELAVGVFGTPLAGS